MMCELCDDTFKRTLTIEVGRAAAMAQRIAPFGAFHIVVEDCNVEDENIEYCLKHEECTPNERVFGKFMLTLDEDDRISALAMAENRYGAVSIYSDTR
jgi:hypothetical protein